MRETLFNWLTPYLHGARCLDLYAGSGVLGFEAVSRGAARATLIERDGSLAAALAALKQRLDADAIEIVNADAQRWLANAVQPFDIVFVDPPFASNLLNPSLALLGGGWLAANAVVYIETARDSVAVDANWTVLKSAVTRHVHYALLTGKG